MRVEVKTAGSDVKTNLKSSSHGSATYCVTLVTVSCEMGLIISFLIWKVSRGIKGTDD